MKNTPQTLLQKAGRKLDAFEFNSAAELYADVLKQQPSSAAALMGMALVYNRTGKNREALALLRKIWMAIEQSSAGDQPAVNDSTKAEILAQMGLSLQILKQDEKALSLYVEADKLHPGEQLKQRITNLRNKQKTAPPIAQLLVKARALRAADKHELAAKTYQQALKLNPDNDVALHGMGDIFRQKGDLQKAMPLIQQAIIMQPAVAEYQNTLGMLFQQKGEHEKAMIFHRRAFEMEPSYAAAHCNLGVALKNLNRLEEAVAAYRKAISINPKLAEAHNNLGNLLRILGDAEGARASLTQALKLRPGYPDATRNLNALKTMTKANTRQTDAPKPALSTKAGAAQPATKGKAAGKSGSPATKTPLKAVPATRSKKATADKKPAKPKSKIAAGVEKSKVAAT